MKPLPRLDYDGPELQKETMAPTPLHQTIRWVREAIERNEQYHDCMEPTAITLATVSPEGRPSDRIVLMRFLDENGPGFVTQKGSRKHRDISHNPYVSASLNWLTIFRAIHFRGVAEEIEPELLQQYWAQRPWGSQISTYISDQSSPIAHRNDLQQRYDEAAAEWPEGTEVPMPDDFIGYRIKVEEVEFWSGRTNRLHDRLLLTSPHGAGFGDPGWHYQRLQP